MEHLAIFCISLLGMSSNALAEEPLELQKALVFDFQNVLKVVRENLNGWNKLSLEGGRTLWTPQSFYSEKISDPKKWISQIRELGFCQPDKTWKNFPVLSLANDQLSTGFEQVALNPKMNYTTQMVYSETVVMGGKARNVSYNFAQNGPKVNVTCSAANEIGDVQTIEQNFDIRNPKQFEVQQKKNGKPLEI